MPYLLWEQTSGPSGICLIKNENNDVATNGQNIEQEEQFRRPPSGFEIEYARAHGWTALVDRTRGVVNCGGRSSDTIRNYRY
jgi:hypothetical protein